MNLIDIFLLTIKGFNMNQLMLACLAAGLFLFGAGYCMSEVEDWFYDGVSRRVYRIIETIFSLTACFFMVIGTMIIGFPLFLNGSGL